MADQVGRIFQGSAVVSFAPYVAGVGGAEPTGHTFTDVGAIIGGVHIDWKREYHGIKSDHAMNELDMIKISDIGTCTFTMEESAAANMAIAMDQPAANVTGSAPNNTLNRTPNSARQKLAMKIVATGAGTGGGSTNTITQTAWWVIVTDVGKSSFMKDKEYLMDVTVRIMQDLTITAASTSQDLKTVFS